jgi:hypothetical protein
MTNAFEKQRALFYKREKKREDKKSNEEKPQKMRLFSSANTEQTLYQEMNAMCERKWWIDSSLVEVLDAGWIQILQLNTLELSFVFVNRYPIVSAMVYTTAYLLDLIDKGGYPIQTSSWWPFSKAELKQLNETELVLASESPEEGPRLAKTNIPVATLLAFLNANTDALSIDEEIVGEKAIENGPEVPNSKADLVNTMIHRLKDSNSFLWTIDYSFGGTSLVYYVTVNR